MRAQWNASEPLKKRAWQRIVIAKIKMQAAALQSVGQPRTVLDHIAAKVQSGDTGNAEAQAARTYWPLLLGPGFRRDPRRPDINALLNYGYTVLRAACARAVIGAGLHPTIGLFHTNRSNAFALVDDLMEPFRPLVDLTARAIVAEGGPDVTPMAKQTLAGLIALDLPLNGEKSPVSVALTRLATSLAHSFEVRAVCLSLPAPPARDVLEQLGK